jgi:hypothetical protein
MKTETTKRAKKRWGSVFCPVSLLTRTLQLAMEEFEQRAAEAERRLALLEKGGVAAKGAVAAKDEEEGHAHGPTELDRANYRIHILLKTLEKRDAALKHAEEELAKRDYQIMHLKRAYDHKA